MDKRLALQLIEAEFDSATKQYGAPFKSTHEGYAVILEELDELWDEIKMNGTSVDQAREAVQIAAMALRYLVDLT